MTQEISLQGEQLLLLPERAVWWPAKHAIILSDLHWGKSAHFRKHGIPMPGITQQNDAFRLADIVRRHHAQRLIIAGDLFHSKHNSEVDNFRHWRDAHPDLNIDFVMGNHDILPAQFYDSLGFRIYQAGLSIGPFYIAHEELAHKGLYTIHGHIHPGVPIRGVGSSQSLPCFAIGAHAMILPAFGRFTGCKRVEPEHYKQVFVIGDSRVMQLK